MVGYALDLGGTVTAEHGLGAGYKREFLLRVPSSTPLMLSLKRLLVPASSTGKVFRRNRSRRSRIEGLEAGGNGLSVVSCRL